MRENGLNARQRRKFIPTANSNHGFPAGENILNREFQVQGAGEKRVSGITYPRTSGGWVYLTAAPDLFDRKVIGRALSAGMETVHTAIPALEMACASRTPGNGLIFHSGRTVLREIVSGPSGGVAPFGSPEREP
jgi:transposase InsO family protein